LQFYWRTGYGKASGTFDFLKKDVRHLDGQRNGQFELHKRHDLEGSNL